MVAELTNEQIVTNLLTSHQILNNTKNGFYITNPVVSLGEYLDNLPTEQIEEEDNNQTESKYTFIKL